MQNQHLRESTLKHLRVDVLSFVQQCKNNAKPFGGWFICRPLFRTLKIISLFLILGGKRDSMSLVPIIDPPCFHSNIVLLSFQSKIKFFQAKTKDLSKKSSLTITQPFDVSCLFRIRPRFVALCFVTSWCWKKCFAVNATVVSAIGFSPSLGSIGRGCLGPNVRLKYELVCRSGAKKEFKTNRHFIFNSCVWHVTNTRFIGDKRHCLMLKKFLIDKNSVMRVEIHCFYSLFYSERDCFSISEVSFIQVSLRLSAHCEMKLIRWSELVKRPCINVGIRLTCIVAKIDWLYFSICRVCGVHRVVIPQGKG